MSPQGWPLFPCRLTGVERHQSRASLVHAIPTRAAQGTSVTAVELAPPGTETPLFRGEFETEMKRQKGMDVVTLTKGHAGIEAGQVEIRPGLSNVLKLMSRIAPYSMLKHDGKDEPAQTVALSRAGKAK